MARDETEGARARRGALGAVGNIAVLERELGKLEYERSKVDLALAASSAAAVGDRRRLEAERDALAGRRAGLLASLDAEHARQARLHAQGRDEG